MADSYSIRDLPDTTPLDPKKAYLVQGKTLLVYNAILKQLWRGENVGKGPNIRLRSNGLGGFTISGADQSSTSIAGGNSFPFQVTTRTNPANPSLYQASVYWNSSLLKNQVLNNTQAITGLADAPSPTGDGNMNWFNFDYGNDLIWLEIVFGSGAASGPTAAYINSYGMASPPAPNYWAPGDLPGEYGTGHGPFEYQITLDSSSNKSFTQYIARIAIFASITSSHGSYPVSNLQLLDNNLILEGDTYSGALYTTADGPAFIGLTMPKPFAGPYISL